MRWGYWSNALSHGHVGKSSSKIKRQIFVIQYNYVNYGENVEIIQIY